MEKKLKKKEGFTLVELIVVVVIIGIITSIAVPVYLNQKNTAYQASVKADVKNSTLAIESEIANMTYGTGLYVMQKNDGDSDWTGADRYAIIQWYKTRYWVVVGKVVDAPSDGAETHNLKKIAIGGSDDSKTYQWIEIQDSGSEFTLTMKNQLTFSLSDPNNYVINGFSYNIDWSKLGGGGHQFQYSSDTGKLTSN